MSKKKIFRFYPMPLTRWSGTKKIFFWFSSFWNTANGQNLMLIPNIYVSKPSFLVRY